MDERIEQVELFEDRAAVTRVATVPAGRSTVRFEGVSSLVSTQRLTTPRQLGDALWVLEDAEVDLITQTISEADGPDVASLRAELVSRQDAVDAASDARDRAEASAERALAALELAKVGSGRALLEGEDAEAWVNSLRTLGGSLQRSTGLAVRLRGQVADAVRLRDVAAAVLNEAEHATQTESATLTLRVHATTAGVIRVRSVVPCAMWRPMHRATLSEDNRTVHWQVRAALWNATGEDWRDVRLICSTARPGQRAEAPELTDDRVHVERRSSDVRVEAREEVVQHARLQDAVQTSSRMQGVDDGGEARVYVVPEPASLVSDGRPVFVSLESFSSACETAWRAIPQLGGHAVRRSTLTNAGSRPLLAGPVALVRGDESVGRTQVGFVATGEPFAVGWGSHDGVRITRKERHRKDTTRVTGTQTHRFEVTVVVRQVSDAPVVVQVDERLPTSELKQVQVELLECVPAFTRPPDRDGACGWRVELEPQSSCTLRFSYTVVAARNVVLPY